MKRISLCAASLIAAAGMALPAQTITGTCQGTLPSPDNSRVVLKIIVIDHIDKPTPN